MLAWLHLNKLQRKVMLIIALIVLLPMLVTGLLSGRWISVRIDESIERWVREAAQLDESALADLHRNARLFADTIAEVDKGNWSIGADMAPFPANLQPLAKELGITLVQVYGVDGALLYSSRPATLSTSWAPGQDTAVVKVDLGTRSLLAAITIIRIPAEGGAHYRLVLGTLFDKALLNRMSHRSGLKTRLFYPSKGDFAKAFSEEGRPLKLRLPQDAFEQLEQHHSYYSAAAEDGHYWGLYSPVIDASGALEAVWFSGHERKPYLAMLTDESLLSLAIVVLGSLLSIGIGLVLSRLVVRPVEYLHNAVMKLAAQDFRTEIPIHSRDELGDLAKAFNAMADSLRVARDEQRREFQRDKLTALGELSLAMAHEIRNPIGIINTASRLIDSSPEAARRMKLCHVIHQEGQRLDQLLNDFQQLAKYRQPQLHSLNPVEPLEKALQVMLAGHDEISLKRRYGHGVRRIRGDGELLRQAWLNLLRNALEAMGSGPGVLEVGSRVDGDVIEIYLHDSGPGVPIAEMTRLFEPFYSNKEHGTGLGLTIANTVTEASGAQLEYVPGDWKGARFAMRIPVSEQG